MLQVLRRPGRYEEKRGRGGAAQSPQSHRPRPPHGAVQQGVSEKPSPAPRGSRTPPHRPQGTGSMGQGNSHTAGSARDGGQQASSSGGDEGARASVGRTQVNTGWGGEVTRAVPAPDGALEGSRAGSAGGPAAAQCKCPPPSSALASQSYPLRAEPLSPVCSHSRQVMLGARKPNATAPSLPSAKALGSATGLDGCPLFSPWLGQETNSGL